MVPVFVRGAWWLALACATSGCSLLLGGSGDDAPEDASIPDDACESCGCEPWWADSPVSVGDLALGDGELYLLGTANDAACGGDRAKITALSTCAGDVLGERDIAPPPPDDADCTTGSGLYWTGTDLIVSGASGSAGTDGWIARLQRDLDDGGPHRFLDGSGSALNLTGVVQTFGGDVFATGLAASSTGVLAAVGSPPCEVASLQHEPTAPVEYNNQIVVASTNNAAPATVSLKLVNVTCAATCSCPAPEETKPFEVFGVFPAARSLAVSGGLAYLAGGSGTDPDRFAFIAVVDLLDGDVDAIAVYQPTPLTDSFFDVAVDGQTAYVVGLSGFDGSIATTSSAFVASYDLPITDNSVPREVAMLDGLGAARVQVEPDGPNGPGRVFVAGTSAAVGTAFAAMCTKSPLVCGAP